VLCEEFGLGEVREKILEQLIYNPDALIAMAQDPEITKVPAVLQDLLVRILTLLDAKHAGADNASQKIAQVKQQVHDAGSQGKQVQGGKAKKAGA